MTNSDLNLSLHNRIYLHFFDRELGRSVDFKLTERLVRNTTCCALIASPAPLYCGLSPIWETSYGLGSIPNLVTQLKRSGHLLLLSSYPTQAEFLASRREAYEHDKTRYPMYFADNFGGLELLTPTGGKVRSATVSLGNELVQWTALPPDQLRVVLPEKAERKKLLKTVSKSLKTREHEAITFALFRRRLGELGKYPPVYAFLRREISTKYTQHYRFAEGGEILTGIDGLAAYDSLTSMFPFYDVPLLTTIIRLLGADALIANQRWDEFLALRGESEHMLFVDGLRIFIAGVCGEAGLSFPCEPTAQHRERLRQAAYRLVHSAPDVSAPMRTTRDVLFACWARLRTIIKSDGHSPGFKKSVLRMEQEITAYLPTRVLLAVATDVEHEAVLQVAREAGLPDYQRNFIGDHTYFNLGVLGGCELLLVKSEAGAGGPSGSLATLIDAVRDTKPDSVVMVGICFGTRPDKHKLCDVLISRQVMAYEKQRIEEENGKLKSKPRGDRVPASPRLLDRFYAYSRDWHQAQVDFGLILSGDKLVDSKIFKELLLEFEPEAIGGEMEAAGVYVAALKGHVDWIVAKAIVDWGEHKDSSYQVPAAMNAANLVLHVIKQGALKR